MPLEPGTSLGPYAIQSPLGAGGMGEVYRARDTKLDRDVALKILPDAFTNDTERLARFQREAKVLASLNHPNIAAIYGLEEADDTRALVLELVEGPTLADRIAEGPIPVDEALPIAKQIAEGLEAAHEQGIVHRDLKPANIKLRPDGAVKVLDFGLAKALEGEQSQDLTNSPTMTARATSAGVWMGTAAYMSPEQFSGGQTDKRADIWSFGVVLWEMLTGQQLFTGETVSHVLAKVLERQPDFDVLPTTAPPLIRRLLRRCLEKEGRQRLHDVADARLDIKEVLDRAKADGTVAESSSDSLGTVPVWRRSMFAAVTLVLGLLIGGLTVGTIIKPTEEWASIARFILNPPSERAVGTPTNLLDLALSPDGSQLVYAGQGNRLYSRAIAQTDVVPLRGADNGVAPFFSYDGEWIGYLDEGNLRKIPADGGTPVTIATGIRALYGASWGPDEQIVFSDGGGGLLVVSSSGGEPELLTTPEGQGRHVFPSLLPDGESILFCLGVSGESWDLAIVRRNSGSWTRLDLGGRNASYSPTGHIVYGRPGGTIRAVSFDLDALQVAGDPVTLVEGVRSKGTISAVEFALSNDGTLAYLTQEDRSQRTLAWVDRTGRETPIDVPPLAYNQPRLSPDGTHLAVDERAPGGSDVWIHDLSRGTEMRLTSDAADGRAPLWTPDGERIILESDRAGPPALYWQRADGTGEGEQLMVGRDGRSLIEATSWSADGRFLVFSDVGGTYSRDIGILSLEGEPTSRLLIASEAFHEAGASVSPSGEWIAYSSDETGRDEVYVQQFPDLGSKVVVSTDGGWQPRWSRDERELFYRGPRGMMAVQVEATPTLRVRTPEVLFEDRYYRGGYALQYDVSPDGRQFLMIKETVLESRMPQIHIALNWDEELMARLPTGR